MHILIYCVRMNKYAKPITVTCIEQEWWFVSNTVPYLTGTSLDDTSSKTPWKRNASGQLIQEALKIEHEFEDIM